jgi:glycosyltransferase involved in cell wall biosynthesis
MHQPLVSVVMPAYNTAVYLKEAVHSILSQSWSNLELIIVNDASTDQTLDIAQDMKAKDPRIRILSNELNKGIVYSRNKGIHASRGRFIACMDADDIALPDRLEKQVNYLNLFPDLGAAGSFYHIMDEKGKHITSITVPHQPDDIATFLLFNVSCCHSTFMMRGDVARSFLYADGFDIIEDYEIAYRISRRFPIGNVPAYTVSYRIHGSNNSIEKKQRLLELRQELDRRVLTDLRIPFSMAEWKLHSDFLNLNHEAFAQEQSLAQLEDWLKRFYLFCLRKTELNHRLIRWIITVRWTIICFRNRQYVRILRNQLFDQFKSEFLEHNFRYLRNRISGVLEVV